ncbi:MAG: efflux RND transporter periplasmic adaptor subunit [Sulfurimonas sp.]|uniref:efflux RND transporter periplasmic adaptor subunit n=1 Tax=Sulfurimonas sp. TaxID=2022749 RepID=UPI0025D5574A|nr:efflux RND transporter periplasmic adaptor subunit [Sulfurimonas sp.]MCK9455000.1 efflux RND transporter periplasmic adaptor subunit [Sulfurimonas sp.]
MDNNSNNTIEETLKIGKNQKSGYKKYIWIFAIVLLIAGAVFWYMTKEAKNKELNFQTTKLEKKTITTTVSATGNMEPTNTVDVGIEVSGTISEVLVDYNEQVKVGQLMARLDTVKLSSKVTSYQAALAKHQANIAEATATLNKAQNEYRRVEKMVQATNGNYPSKQEVDSALAAYELAMASLQAAKAGRDQASAELKAAQDDLKKAAIVSPINGVVLDRKIEPGQSVVASMTIPVLFTMAEDLTKMKVVVSVDEADIADVKEQQRVKFSVDAYPQKLFEGTLTQLRLNSQIVNGVVTYDAVVNVDNSELLLRPGMTVTAQIVTDILENVSVLPNAALRFTPPIEDKANSRHAKTKTDISKHYVWILRENRPLKIEVEIGKSDGSFTVIKKAEISENDLVLIGTKES